jgi:hypothetical protein
MPKVTNWQKVYHDRMDEFKKEDIFPDAELLPDFKSIIHTAFSFHSPNHIKMQVADYVALLEKDDNYSLLEMEHIFAAMQNKTAFQLKMTMPAYCQYITDMQSLIDVWAEIIRTKAAGIEIAVKAEMDAEMETATPILEEVLGVTGQA